MTGVQTCALPIYGVQATTTVTETVDGEEVTTIVPDTDKEPGIADQEMRITEWIYVSADKWRAFAANHGDLVAASIEDVRAAAKADSAEAEIPLTGADGTPIVGADGAALTAPGELREGVWVRNIIFGEDRYTALTSTVTGIRRYHYRMWKA